MKSVNILFFFLLLGITFHCPITEFDYDNFDAALFFQKCNWEDMKLYYYQEKNKPVENQTEGLVGKIEVALNAMKDLREEYIDEAIKVNFGKECLIVRPEQGHDNSMTYKEVTYFVHFQEHMGGQKKYFRCGNLLYVLNSFGSQTPTSDYDFSVLMLRPEKILHAYNQDLEDIKEVTLYLAQAFEYISLMKCEGRPSESCLDSNGYPEIMVFYNSYFRNTLFLNVAKFQLLRYSNALSSRILKYCAIAPLHYYRLEKLEEGYELRKDDLRNICYLKMRELIDYVEGHYETPLEYKDSERLFDPYPSDVEEGIRKNKAVYHPENYNFYLQNVKNLTDHFLIKRDFNQCVSNVDNPRYFLFRSFSLKTPIRVIQSLRTTYEVWDDIFMIPATIQKEKVDIVNRFIPMFIGACHIWASEAYIMFGSLGFVKEEKKLLTGEKTMECHLYIESFIENMGMMLYHMAEYIKENDFQQSVAGGDQILSDITAKYLRRALLSIETPCVNAWLKLIQSFWVDKGDFEDTLETDYYKFYAEIRAVDQSLPNKKDLYFAAFNKILGQKKMGDLVSEGIRFFEDVFAIILSNLDLEKLFLK